MPFLLKENIYYVQKLRIVILHFKIISETRNYNNSFIINKNKCIQGRLRTPLPDTVRYTSDSSVRGLPNKVFFLSLTISRLPYFISCQI